MASGERRSRRSRILRAPSPRAACMHLPIRATVVDRDFNFGVHGHRAKIAVNGHAGTERLEDTAVSAVLLD